MTDEIPIARKWGWFVVLGIISVLGGVFALGHPLIVTLAGVIFIGAALLVSGVAQIVQAFMTKGWSGFLFSILGGLLSIIAGVLIMQEPVAGSVIITMFLLAVLVVSGVLRIMLAFRHRHMSLWWLMALGGLVSVVVGIMLYQALPWSGLWVLGTLIAVEMIVQGISWIGFGMDLRKLGQSPQAAI